MKITGSYIKELRKSRNLTQRELSQKTGYSQAHIAKIENEKVDPRLSTVNKIVDFLEKKQKCEDIMTTSLFYVSPNTKIEEITNIMKERNISQVPVIEKGIAVGTITDEHIMEKTKELRGKKAMEVMSETLPIISKNSDIKIAKSLLKIKPALLLSEKGKIVGIITRADFLKFLQ